MGVGPVYTTATKANSGAAIGLEGLAAVTRAVGLRSVAIGGIGASNAAACIAAGAEGVAVVSAIMGADDPQAAAQALL
ncbi:thiamine phosphate synthase, partial [Rhodoplanes roseus]